MLADRHQCRTARRPKPPSIASGSGELKRVGQGQGAMQLDGCVLVEPISDKGMAERF